MVLLAAALFANNEMVFAQSTQATVTILPEAANYAPSPARHYTALAEDFESEFAWSPIRNGTVAVLQTDDAISGSNTALKSQNNDPHGASIPLEQPVDDFEVILYTKRTDITDGKLNRYSILQNAGNGYGFYLSDSSFAIEKRGANLNSRALASDSDVGWTAEKWNTIRFIKQGDSLRADLFLNQVISHDTIHVVRPDSTISATDSTHAGGFRNAAIHGGQTFETDDYYVWSLSDDV